jgi:hypothetical protein
VTAIPQIDYLGIRASERHLAILDGQREVVVIPLDSVRSITLRNGLTAERPLLEALLGLALCALGLLAVRRTIAWFRFGGGIWDVEMLTVVCFPFGFMLLRSAAHRGYYLHVRSTADSRKLAFSGVPDADLPAMLRQIEVVIHRSIDIGQYRGPAA